MDSTCAILDWASPARAAFFMEIKFNKLSNFIN